MYRNGILANSDITDAIDQDEDILIIPFSHESLSTYGYEIHLHSVYFPLKTGSGKDPINPWADDFLVGTWSQKPQTTLHSYLDLPAKKSIMGFSEEFLFVQDQLAVQFAPIDRLIFSGVTVSGKDLGHLTRWPLIITNTNQHPVRIPLDRPVCTLSFIVSISQSFYPRERVYDSCTVPSLKTLKSEWNPKEIFVNFDDRYHRINWDSNTSSRRPSTYRTKSLHVSGERSLSPNKKTEKGKEQGKEKEKVHTHENPVVENPKGPKLTKNQRKNLRRRLKKHPRAVEAAKNDKLSIPKEPSLHKKPSLHQESSPDSTSDSEDASNSEDTSEKFSSYSQ